MAAPDPACSALRGALFSARGFWDLAEGVLLLRQMGWRPGSCSSRSFSAGTPLTFELVGLLRCILMCSSSFQCVSFAATSALGSEAHDSS